MTRANSPAAKPQIDFLCNYCPTAPTAPTWSCSECEFNLGSWELYSFEEVMTTIWHLVLLFTLFILSFIIIFWNIISFIRRLAFHVRIQCRYSISSLRTPSTHPSTPSQKLLHHLIPTLPQPYKSSRNHRQRIKHTSNQKRYRHPHSLRSQGSCKNVQHKRITNSMTETLENTYCSVNSCPWWFGDPVRNEGEGWDAGAEPGCEDGYSLSWVSICISWEGLNWERKKSVGTYQ